LYLQGVLLDLDHWFYFGLLYLELRVDYFLFFEGNELLRRCFLPLDFVLRLLALIHQSDAFGFASILVPVGVIVLAVVLVVAEHPQLIADCPGQVDELL
jgi:hypothetical protein